jgi:predicted transcriptional regulator
MVTKVTLNLPSELVEQIKQVARVQSLTVTEVFRRGLQTYLFLTKEEAQGGKILVQKGNGSMVELRRQH